MGKRGHNKITRTKVNFVPRSRAWIIRAYWGILRAYRVNWGCKSVLRAYRGPIRHIESV